MDNIGIRNILRNTAIFIAISTLLAACGGNDSKSTGQAQLLASSSAVKINLSPSLVTASSVDATNVPANAVDGDLNTHWTGGAASGTQWIKFFLGSCYKVDYAKLAWYRGNERKYNYTIEVSKDLGGSWTTVSTGASSGTSAGLAQIDFTDTSANAIRVSSTGSDVSTKVSLSDVEFWAVGNGLCQDITTTSLPPTTTTTKLTSTTTSTTTTSTGTTTSTLPKILTGAVFTIDIEGPSVDTNGDLYVPNFNHNGSIGVIKSGTTTPQLFLDLPKGSVSSGTRFDASNNMYATDYVGHNIYKIDVVTKKVTTYAHNATMNQPNDLALMGNGVIFVSDPNWNNNTGRVWRINTDGSSVIVANNMGLTNGIEVSADNKTLYVGEGVIVWKFTIDAAGNVSNKVKLITLSSGETDGMRRDDKGNLYVANYGKGTVVVISPTGTVLREVRLNGANPTNVAFSRDYKKCYVTLQDKRWVEVFDVK